MTRKRNDPFYDYRRKWEDDEKPFRRCDHEGCDQPGEYRAPKDRSLNDYYWFCLKHVTEYNENWDYFAGMSDEDIEKEILSDYGWGRPTRQLADCVSPRMYADPFGLKREAFGADGEGRQNFRADPAKAASPEMAAAAVALELTIPFDEKQVKANYKRLAKACHPDLTGGDKELEDRFKTITEAYRLIMSVLSFER